MALKCGPRSADMSVNRTPPSWRSNLRTHALSGLVVLLLSVALIAPAQAVAPSRAHHDRATPLDAAAPEVQPREAAPQRPDYAGGRILVAPKPGAGPKPLATLNASVGAKVQQVLPGTTVREVHLPKGLSVEQAVRRYESSGAVAYAEPDYLVEPADLPPVIPNDPGFGYLYGLDNHGQTAGTADADIDAPEAWATTTGKAATLVAVIDTGVDITHPDLSENIWSNPGEIAGNGIDDDNNGYVDDVHGWDFFSNDNSVFDNAADDAHGTHVAGTVAASGDNGIGVTGVAWRASLMPLKFIDGERGGPVSGAIEALDYAVANGATISNNSWGAGASYSQALHDAIKSAQRSGHLFVAAAGNGGGDGVGDDIDLAPVYPASYPEENVVTVAATNHNDRLAAFSNYGDTDVDLAAPGVKIVSTTPTGTYSSMSGTSMAAPHVTGAAALLLSIDPTLTAAQLKDRLITSADAKSGLESKTVAGGRLNVRSAVTEEPVRTEVALTATRAAISLGRKVGFSGTLKAEGSPVAGEKLALQRRLVGRRAWRKAGTDPVVTTADGSFTFSGLHPLRNADYRARFAGNESRQLAPAHSARQRVKVRARVILRTTTRRLSVGDAQRLSGRVEPRRRGKVRVVVLRQGNVVKRTRVRPDNKQYALTYRPTRSGRYVVRVIRLGDQRNVGARAAKRFRVTAG
jgi:thermitase